MTPKKTGRLAKSVRAGATQKAGVVRADSNGKVKYAGVINYGWPKHSIKATLFFNKAAGLGTQWYRFTRTRCRRLSTESRQEIYRNEQRDQDPEHPYHLLGRAHG